MTNDQAKLLTLETPVTVIDPATNKETSAMVKGIDEDGTGNITVTAAYVTPMVTAFKAEDVKVVVVPVVETVAPTEKVAEVSDKVAEATAVVAEAPVETPIPTSEEVAVAPTESTTQGAEVSVDNTPSADQNTASIPSPTVTHY